MEFKLCPIMTTSGSSIEEGCREDCALYVRGRCVLVDIADSLVEISMDTAVHE